MTARTSGQAGTQARPRRIGLRDRGRAWRRHHSQSAADSLARVLGSPASSCLTWMVLGIAIALPTGLWVLLDNLDRAGGSMEYPASVSLFLTDAVSSDSAQALAGDLEARAAIRAVRFIDRDTALANLAERSDLGDLMAGLPANPLPHVLIVEAQSDSPTELDALSRELETLAGVDEVVVDAQWLQRLGAMMALGRRAVQILAGLLLFAVVLVLGNTIRLAIENRRDEIVISKLVGGSNAFVRRPFLYTGLWFGLGGGVFAAVLNAVGVALLRIPVETLAAAYQSSFELRALGLVDSLQLILVGAVLGLAGAWLAVGRHLREIEPR